MPFLLDDDHRQIVQEAERVLSDGWSPDGLRHLLERVGAHDDHFWTTCRDMGWTGITISEDHGGLGLGPIALCLTAEVVGRFVGGAPFLSTGYGVSEALRRFGSNDQQGRYQAGLANGEKTGAIDLTSALDGGERLAWTDGRLSGATGLVAAGAWADLLVTVARDTATGGDVLVLVALDKQAHREPVQTFDNSRGYAVLHFNSAPAEVLATEHAGDAALELLARVAVIVAFEQLGGAEACMERARNFANERQAFGQPIGKFQAIKHRIAEMYVANELARGNALRAALSLRDDAGDLVLRAGAARLTAIDAYEFAATEAIQTHGAIGITWEHDLHLFFRRSRALALELGGRGPWQDVVARRVIAGVAA